MRKIFLDEDNKLKSNVTLDKDYLLTDEWTPINPTANYKDNVIDGQGHTIYNMSVNKGNSDKLGFIGYNTDKLTIKNLTFSNANIYGTSNLGVVIGYQYGKVTLDNVHVVNSTVKSSGSWSGFVGGLVGYSAINDSATLTLANCSVENSNFESSHDTCGLVGAIVGCASNQFSSNYSISGCVVSGCHFLWGWQRTPSGGTTGNNFALSDAYAGKAYNEIIEGVTATDNTYEYGSS